MSVNNTSPPVISGTPQQGQTLTSSEGSWTFDLDYLTYAYQWMRCDTAGDNCIDIGSATNRAYVLQSADVGSTIRVEVTATEHTLVGGDELSWAPPTPGAGGVAVVHWTMTNANRMDGALLSGGGRDLVITSGEALTGGVQQLNNWRHIIWIGGKITNTPGSGNNYALPLSHTGTAHIEGLDIRCDGDNIMTRGGSASAIVQIQNCRLNAHIVGAEHADCFQTQGNTQLDELRFDRCTLTTDYQGMFLRLSPSSAFLNGGDVRKLNFRRRNVGSDPQQAFFYLVDEDPDAGHPPGSPIGTFALSDVWAEGSHSSKSSIFYPGWTFQTSVAVPNLGPYSNKEGLFKLTDGTGQYVRPSTTADTVPAGGPASGQQCESAGWTGIIRFGIPPGGDWCPDGVPGMAYVSPGYL